MALVKILARGFLLPRHIQQRERGYPADNPVSESVSPSRVKAGICEYPDHKNRHKENQHGACTNAGLKVVIPHLPGLREFIVAEDDLQRLERILDCLPENGPGIGLIGFSTGGSYSLLLAANPALKHKIGPVILFSPIYDVRDVAERCP